MAHGPPRSEPEAITQGAGASHAGRRSSGARSRVRRAGYPVGSSRPPDAGARGAQAAHIINEEHRLIGVVALPDLDGDPIPRSKAVKLAFNKEKTDAYGRPHKVPVKTVCITGATDRAGAEAAAVTTIKGQEGTTWTNVATSFESEEEQGSAGHRGAG